MIRRRWWVFRVTKFDDATVNVTRERTEYVYRTRAGAERQAQLLTGLSSIRAVWYEVVKF